MKSDLQYSQEEPPKVMFVCRGSVKDGLGHVTRSRAVAKIMGLQAETLLVCIGDPYVENLLRNHDIDYKITDSEQDVIVFFQNYYPGIVVFDLLEFDNDRFKLIANSVTTVSLSPVFNCLSQVDIIFHRTSYWDDHWRGAGFKPMIKSGLNYTVVSEHCERIRDDVYQKNLEFKYLSIAISMGGTDAANKTLQVLTNIKDIPERLVIWVMLGEGYTHSYQDLVDCMGKSSHEIILAKSNDSMWRILSTCSLAILSGGTTTYEAVYAGLPSINLLVNKQSLFLIQELVDRGVVLPAGQSFEEGLLASRQLLRDIYHDRVKLLTMHQNTQGLIDNQGAQRIVEEILQIGSSRKTPYHN